MSGLRVSIAQSALEAINVLQIATQTLVTSCPLSGQLDKRNHYSAFLSAEDLGIAGIDTAEGAELPLVLLKVNIITDINISDLVISILSTTFYTTFIGNVIIIFLAHSSGVQYELSHKLFMPS